MSACMVILPQMAQIFTEGYSVLICVFSGNYKTGYYEISQVLKSYCVIRVYSFY